MALVEAARFLDRNEAFIARAALINDGVYADVRDNGYANMIFGMAIATGGYALLVDAGDLETARALLDEANPPSDDALNWTDHPQHLTGIPMAALGAATALATGAEASAILGARRKFTLVNILVAAIPIAAVAGLVYLFLFT